MIDGGGGVDLAVVAVMLHDDEIAPALDTTSLEAPSVRNGRPVQAHSLATLLLVGSGRLSVGCLLKVP